MSCSNNKKETKSETSQNCCIKHKQKMEGNISDESKCEDLIVTGKTKKRTEKEYKDLYNRLSRIEGQVRGVKKMVENDVYCVDILTQVSAITSALNSFNKVLLANHIKSCVIENVKEGNEEVIDELVKTIQKLMK